MNNTKQRQNVKQLIFAVSTFLLVMAFYAQYDIASSKDAYGEITSLNPLFAFMFLFGLFSLCSLFIAYIANKKPLIVVSYLSPIPFILVIINIFTGDKRHFLSNLGNLSSFWVFYSIILFFIIIELIMVYYLFKIYFKR